MSMDFCDIQNQATELAELALQDAHERRPDALGLDRRSASRIWVGRDFLAVPMNEDRTLQYYGGFEYVDSEYRMQLGNWVFYSIECERVCGHWEMAGNER